MPVSTGFANPNILMLRIAHSAYRRSAFLANHSHFAARQNNTNPVTLFGDYLRSVTGAANHFAALTRRHFNIVNLETRRYRTQRHRIARLRLANSTALHPITNLYAKGSKNISLFTVRIVQQRNEAIPVRIIFDARNRSRNAVLFTLEIDNTIDTSSAAPTETRGRNAVMVPAAGLLNPLAQRILGLARRQLGIVIDRTVPASCTGRFVNSNTHNFITPSSAFSGFRTNQYGIQA